MRSVAVSLLAVGLLTCHYESTPRPVGERCEDDSECESSLVCAYGRCRPVCAQDRDCPDGAVCVEYPLDGSRVCTLGVEMGCEGVSCALGFVCVEGDCVEQVPTVEMGCEGIICGSGYECVEGDCVAACEHEVCDVWPQCGCPAGERCVVGADASRCVTIGGLPHGSQCSAEEDCAAGTCFMVGEVGICLQYCGTDDDCSALGPGSACAMHLGFAETFSACSVSCDPTTGGGCPAGIQCLLSNIELSCRTGCWGPGTPGAEEAECMEQTPFECPVGWICETGFCRPYCVVGEPCDVPGECVPLTAGSCIIERTEYGVCR